MTATKFITFAIGCLLLLPFIWSFVLMVLPAPAPTAEETTLLAQEKARMEAEASFPKEAEGFVMMGFTNVTTYKAVTLHPGLCNVWLLASRGWVGAVGLVACLALFVCLFISSFFPVVIDSFGYEHHVQLPKESEMQFQIENGKSIKAGDDIRPKIGD